MRFTVELEPFLRTIEEVKDKVGNRLPGNMARLIASRGRVFIEGKVTTAEIDAAVTEEGQCKVPMEKFLKLLKTRTDPSITVEADTAWLRIGASTIPISGYSAYAVEPPRFQIYLANEAGLVPSKFMLSCLAHEP
ncbi:MAG TPA: hypothetical protein VN673_12895 [Clostridia bacterium]|nr:hypothetical protein [Clostridia bacterium]